MNLDKNNAIVHIIDDDDIMLNLLSEMVRSIGLGTRCYANGDEFVSKYVQLPCECIVSDLRMPGISGIQLQKLLHSRYPLPSPLLLITGYAEVNTAVEAMKLGAFDYIEKPVNGLAFLEKVQSALETSKGLNRERLERSAREARLALLTSKEREVLGKLLLGNTSKEIATALGLSVRTVENHRARMMSKLHVNTATELVREFLLAKPENAGG